MLMRKNMVEQLFPNLYRIEVPLPRNPLKALNSYAVKAGAKTLIIDTGMNREECRVALLDGLKELDVDVSKADFFITHLHADHLGLVSSLATDASVVYFNEPDAQVLRPEEWTESSRFAGTNGFPEKDLEAAIHNHPGYKYGLKRPMSFRFVNDNDVLTVGDYSFRCIQTPGHTPGHMCLYEPQKKLFISGDHVLSNITSNISVFSFQRNALAEYLASLDRVYNLEVKLVLPGHRRVFEDFRGRIRELKHHHEVRADEVLRILRNGKQNAYRVASRMTWDIDCKSWEAFPVQQRWFAVGEAMAHLLYLERQGKVAREAPNGTVVFGLV